jgi:hypothetical protein
MDAYQDQFFNQLLALSEGRSRVHADQVWRAFRSTFRDQTGSPDERASLLVKLTDLQDFGQIAMPRGKTHWDRTATPAIPHWISLKTHGRGPAEVIDHRSIAWRPELAFVADLDRVQDLDILLRINEFIKSANGRTRMVPMRERSVQLFGDEKRLESLVGSSIFQPGRVSLDLLRCFPVSPPLVWQKDVSRLRTAGSLLILENHHTYWSFARWNADSHWYAAVIFGHGKVLEPSVEYLRDILAETGATAIEYFGDIDWDGIRIPLRASAKAIVRGLPPICAAEKWYSLLLDVAQDAEIRTDSRGTPLKDEEWDWMPLTIRERARTFLASGRRIPQELVGWECLASLSDGGACSDQLNPPERFPNLVCADARSL